MRLSQAQNNFKKFVSECMCVSLTQRAAVELKRVTNMVGHTVSFG